MTSRDVIDHVTLNGQDNDPQFYEAYISEAVRDRLQGWCQLNGL